MEKAHSCQNMAGAHPCAMISPLPSHRIGCGMRISVDKSGDWKDGLFTRLKLARGWLDRTGFRGVMLG